MTVCRLKGCGGQTLLRYRLRLFNVVCCRRCGMLSRDPFPDDAEIRAMYEDPTYHASEYFAPIDRRGSSGPEARIHADALAWLDALSGTDSTRPRQLLDVGCGNGVFLVRAQAQGWQTEGVELSNALAERCRSETGIDPRCGDYLEVAPMPERYDVISMWDFLEHTRDPSVVLDRAMGELKPDGRLLIFTIDTGSLFNMIGNAIYLVSLGRFRFASELLYDARHNYYFSQKTLEALLTKAGYAVERRASYRAHLGRWLAEPAPAVVKLTGDVIDAASAVLGRRYRQLLICRRQRV